MPCLAQTVDLLDLEKTSVNSVWQHERSRTQLFERVVIHQLEAFSGNG